MSKKGFCHRRTACYNLVNMKWEMLIDFTQWDKEGISASELIKILECF
jgi:hypothetical protein